MGASSAAEHIDVVDAIARTLYLRAKQSGLAFADVASAVRQIHLALRHLRVEAVDPDSLLNRGNAPVYARQLQPMVEDCNFTLAQLESLLDKFGDGRPSGGENTRDDRLALIRSRLQTDKTNIDMFLDTIQLHNAPEESFQVINGDQAGLESIKDKVDQIAHKLFNRRDSSAFTNDEDSLWLEFRTELEKEGFAPQVLRKHKDILRAYIRELESVANMHGGQFPTVRGLLERETHSRPTSSQDSQAPRKSRRLPVVIHNGRNEEYESRIAPLSSSPEQDSTTPAESTALISTHELMALDKMNSGLANLSLQPPGRQHYDSSHRASDIPGSVPNQNLSAPSSFQHFGMSPQTTFHMPSSTREGLPPSGYGSSPRNNHRLAPDRYGQEIPDDAQWTRIKRTLVSPEVLERAGVRYEARPEFVAVLGRLTRQEITEYARQSAACRAARYSRTPPTRRGDRYPRDRAESKSSRDEEEEESDLWEHSDSTDYDDDKTSDKGSKSYPFIVNPPKKTSPSSTVQPKPILKNKNDNHVRFDTNPQEIDSSRPRSLKDDRGRRARYESSGSSSRKQERERSRRYSDGGERYRNDRGDYYDSSRRHNRDRGDRRGQKRDDRTSKTRLWGETLGAVGIGGAAVSLLSVLAEAASG